MLSLPVISWRHLFLCNKVMSKNPNNQGKLMKIANIDREILHILWTTWGISMKFSGKMWLMIILKVTKNQGFIVSLEDTFFEKPHGGVNLTRTHAHVPEKLRIQTYFTQWTLDQWEYHFCYQRLFNDLHMFSWVNTCSNT